MIEMDCRIATILTGTIIAIGGLAFAFMKQETDYLSLVLHGYPKYIFLAFPNLISGLIVAIGGIIIAIIGSVYFKRVVQKQK